MTINDQKIDTIRAVQEWEVSVEKLAEILQVDKRHVLKAINAMAKEKQATMRRAEERTGVLLVDRTSAFEIWDWMWNHLERRAYDPNSTSRKVAGRAGCPWLERWTPPAGVDDALPEELEKLLAEERKYSGVELSKMLEVSTFKISRTALRLGYKGGRYLRKEARHVANCLARNEPLRATP